ncbi:MAG: hypothetical protein KDK70_31110 [Myxococcales bacterium]|nr:hypothetical protein [Myxococcales bacterium]
MRRLGVTAGLGMVLGCTSSSVFICEGDAECGDGRCEANGYCSFPSSGCASGWAYGELSAPSLAGMCVEEGLTATDDGSTGSPGESSAASADGPATSPPSTGDVTGSPPTTGVAEASSEPPTTGYGEDTGYVPAWCGSYAELIAQCYGDLAGKEALADCVQSYVAYDAQGDACLYAFDDLLACLSSLDCSSLRLSKDYCFREQTAFDAVCMPQSP